MKADAIGLLMNIDTVIYGFIDYVYDIFNALAKVNIFDIEDYKIIVSRIYVILGMIMLFSLAYSLLKAVINPDEFAKGENSFPKLVKNVVVSLAIIAVLPSAFTLAFNVQNTILNQDTIPKLVFGTGEDYNSATRDDAGKDMAYYVLSAFLHPNIEWCENQDPPLATDDGDGGDINLSACASNIKGDGGWLVTDGEILSSVTEKFKAGTYGISAFNDFGESAAAGKLTYNAFISTIAGTFMLYVLLNFCFDMAVRVVKLMFFQIIAPIPVVCRVIPGGKLKDVFSDWMKKTISTYVEVFIRIAIMYLGVFMISQVVGNFENVSFGGLGATQKLIAKALIIMGVVIFMRQAPKLIGDMFHLDSGSMKLGLMDKLAMGGALAAASTVGGAGGMLLKNGAGAIKNVRNAEGFRNKVGAAIRGLGSTVAGTASGATRGFRSGRGAKNFKDVKNSSNTAINEALAAKAKRAAYRAAHQETSHNNGIANYLGTTANVIGGHILDTAGRVGEFIGINDSAQDLIDENKLIDDIAAKKKSVATSVESVIDKEAGKATSNFRVGNFTATELRNKLLAIEDAKAGNLKDAAGNAITVAQAQQMYDQYRYDFSQAAQNMAFLSDEHFRQLEQTDNDVYVKLYAAHANAEGMRETVSRNLNKSYVQDAGFTLEYVQGDMKVDDGTKPLKKMGDIFDVAKAKNEGEIARRQREANANKEGK